MNGWGDESLVNNEEHSGYNSINNFFMTPASPIPTGQFTPNDEPPLLEELGINLDHIGQKMLSVLNPFRKTRPEVAADADLAGPLAFCMTFGSLLLLTGKVHFSHIYGFGGSGCLGIFCLLSLMSNDSVGFWAVASTLGYCILPVVGLSSLGVLVSLQGVLGVVASLLAVSWCSASASNLFVSAYDLQRQRLLIAYPCFLLYGVFALITIF